MSDQPKASKKQVVVFGRLRITVLASRFLRLEWAEDSVFEDRRTFLVVNRKTRPVKFTTKIEGDTLTLDTGEIELVVTDNGKPLNSSNCRASFVMEGEMVTWKAGKKDRKNLGGTIQTLDGWNGDRTKKWIPAEKADPKKLILNSNGDGSWVHQGDYEKRDLGEGLISRSGWAVVDDSKEVVLDPEACDWTPWVTARPEGERQDLYFLAYGLDYSACLLEAGKVFGHQPLPPRYALGYWYSRYWAYTDKEIEELVHQHDRMDVPLDVMVIDMDWHKMGWTGYTWDADYFPDHAETLEWLHSNDIKTSLNLHPAEGVYSYEDAFEGMAKAMDLKEGDLQPVPDYFHKRYTIQGLDPKAGYNIPLDVCDPIYMNAYFEKLHRPMENEGVDVWWMDWQQGNQGSAIENLRTLPWINELHWQDQLRARPDQRPINFSRYGGIGAGRMPIGFSGDTIVTWESLAFQPKLTATASNVLYGTWSHDIGGHMGGEDRNSELYTRWMQFGMLSPVLRTHTSKDARKERRVFEYEEPYKTILIETLRRRYELVPYIYGQLRKAEKSGISLCRPMYYDHPCEDAAYRCPDQYMFGESLLAAPVIKPCKGSSEMAEVKVWLPKGEWIDLSTGQSLEGGQVHQRAYLLSEAPLFAKPGTILPGQVGATRLKEGSYEHLLFEVYGVAQGQADLYEDDGISFGYRRKKSASIKATTQPKGQGLVFELKAAKGAFKGFLKRRDLTLRFFCTAPPKKVVVGGKVLPWSHRPNPGAWSYDGDRACVVVELEKVNVTKGLEVELKGALTAHGDLDGFAGLMAGLERVRYFNCLVSPTQPLIQEERFAVNLAQTGNRISRDPSKVKDELQAFCEGLPTLSAVLLKYQKAYAKKDATVNASSQAQVDQLKAAREILTATLKRQG